MICAKASPVKNNKGILVLNIINKNLVLGNIYLLNNDRYFVIQTKKKKGYTVRQRLP